MNTLTRIAAALLALLSLLAAPAAVAQTGPSLKEVLASDEPPAAEPSPNEDARVRFTHFGEYSLDLDVYAYLDTDIVDAAGTGFAFPSQSTYVEQSSGMNAERGRAAEESIGGMRAEGRLPFPQFSEAEVEELRGTLSYPPKGSHGAVRARPAGPGDVR
ncbi:MAG: hypothetical protein JRH19_20005 [Deltaproteobacteria bacterium]|nr:hypothetical protein [Deltaproteobacteria bacterium]